MNKSASLSAPLPLSNDHVTLAYSPIDRKKLWSRFLSMQKERDLTVFFRLHLLSDDERMILGFLRYMEYSEPATHEQYLREIVHIYNYVLKPFSGFGIIHVQEYIHYLLTVKRLKETSIQTKIAPVRAFFTWLKNINYIQINVLSLVRLPKVLNDALPNIIQRALDEDDVDKALTTMQTEFKARDLSIFYTMSRMGLRASEICGLTWAGCARRLGKWSFEILGKGKKLRILAIPKPGLSYLMQYRFEEYRIELEAPTPTALQLMPVYPHHNDKTKAMGRHNLYRIMRRVARHAGLRQFSPHDLRHTCLTHMSQLGVRLEDIQLAAGHEKIDTSRNYVNAGRLISQITSVFD